MGRAVCRIADLHGRLPGDLRLRALAPQRTKVRACGRHAPDRRGLTDVDATNLHGEDRDHVTGTATTGHQWDGIKELNTPLPRWWLWTFYITIIWSIGYWVVYPAWPTITGHTAGLLGYSSRADLGVELQKLEASRMAQARRSPLPRSNK